MSPIYQRASETFGTQGPLATEIAWKAKNKTADRTQRRPSATLLRLELHFARIDVVHGSRDCDLAFVRHIVQD